MGYRVWNNYEEEAARDYRQRVAALPLRRRILLRAWQALVLSLVIGLLALLIMRGVSLI